MTIYIAATAYVEPSAKVVDNAQISDNVHIYDNARIFGNAQIAGNAQIFGNARISDNACISGDTYISNNARIMGNADIQKTSDYLLLGPAKSSERFTTAYKDSVIGVRVNCGCFSGSVEKFILAIQETHRDNPEYLAQYMAFVHVIKVHFNIPL